jgi:hypothetical protein
VLTLLCRMHLSPQPGQPRIRVQDTRTRRNRHRADNRVGQHVSATHTGDDYNPMIAGVHSEGSQYEYSEFLRKGIYAYPRPTPAAAPHVPGRSAGQDTAPEEHLIHREDGRRNPMTQKRHPICAIHRWNSAITNGSLCRLAASRTEGPVSTSCRVCAGCYGLYLVRRHR